MRRGQRWYSRARCRVLITLALIVGATAACGGGNDASESPAATGSAAVTATATRVLSTATSAAPMSAATSAVSAPIGLATPPAVTPSAPAATVPSEPPTPEPPVALSPAAMICASNAPDVISGNVQPVELREISGLAVSRRQAGVIWAHNDSGDTARVFALDAGGRLLGTYELAGVTAIDVEDMAIGPGPDAGVTYLYVGDIGDNASQRTEVVVYRMPEPDFAGGGDTEAAAGVVAMRLRYPDSAHDAETLLVDPASGDVYVMTKDIIAATSRLYRIPAGAGGGAASTLEYVADIPFGQFTPRTLPDDAPVFAKALGKIPTGGDISPAGDVIAIRTYGTVWVWDRAPGQSIVAALAGAPCEGPSAVEPQGEAIAVDADGGGYWTASEGAEVPLHHLRWR